MELEGSSNAGPSATFLAQLRRRHVELLNVTWDNAPVHRGEAMREYLRTPGLELRLVNLPGYSPDFNAAEAVYGAGRGRRPLATCAWGPERRYKNESGTSWPGWSTGKMR